MIQPSVPSVSTRFPKEMVSMRTRFTAAVAIGAAAAALAPAAVSAGTSPADTVQADLTQLTAAVGSAHDTLLADLHRIASDAASLQGSSKATARATIASDLQQFRADRIQVASTVGGDRSQLVADVKAARAANVDLTSLKPAVQAAFKQNAVEQRGVAEAMHEARVAVRTLVQDLKS
jgi:hypothetical protein